MALSVSGFPEPLRQLSEQDAESSILANNPRLRGFFGKKPEPKPPSRQNTDESIPSSPPSPTPRSPQIPIISDEQLFLAQMAMQTPEPLPTIPQRQRQISLTRRTPPPVKRQPSLGRLEIGTSPRVSPGSPPLHTLPKPPTVVVQEWSMKNTEPTLPLPRPLPAVPNPGPIIESSKSAALRNMQQRQPTSKVLMSPTRPRAQTTAPQGVSVRYQPLVVEKEAGPSSAQASSTVVSPNTASSNGQQIRPLPRIPPASTTNASPPAPLPRFVPRPARVKRPKTSPSSSNGFSTNARSPFDAVPNSWASMASRPVDLNPTQPGQSTSPIANQAVPGPSSRATYPARPRSRSRSRRDHSADVPSASRTPTSSSGPRRPALRTAPSSPITSTSAIKLPSARPSTIRTTTYHVKPSNSPISSPKLGSSTNRFISDRGVLPPPPTTIVEEIRASVDHSGITDGSSHPVERLGHEELARKHTRSTPSPEIPVEVFIDDEDLSSALSRSPSPMRYARPNSRGSLSDDSFSDSRSRSRAIRDQLRSYRKSYRGPMSPERSPSPIRYARRSSLEGLDEPATSASPKRRAQPRSYQFDYKAAQDSSPFNRVPTGANTPVNSSADSKSVSSKSRRARSKGSGNSRPSRSRSPRRSRFGTPNESVIDISMPSTLTSTYQELAAAQQDLSRSGPDYGRATRLRTSESDTTRQHDISANISWNEKDQWFYKDDNAVVVTTIQPNREVWKEEEMKRVIPKLRNLKVRN